MYPEPVICYISGNYSKEDEEFVKNWISKDPGRREEIEELRKLWIQTGSLKMGGDANDVWLKLHNQIASEPSSKVFTIHPKPIKKSDSRLLSLIIWAAAAVLIIAGAYTFTQFNYTVPEKQEQLVYHTLESREGEQIHYRFNDGSKVVLNSNSRLRFRSDFGKATRQMELTGEAYFEVNHDHELPFIVQTSDITVKDIGTKFNINAYPENKNPEVVTSEGSVAVTDSRSTNRYPRRNVLRETVLIKQGQKATLNPSNGELIVARADLHAALGWLNKRLIFDEEPLVSVAKKLERYYGIIVIVKDRTLLTKRITASFENERMENVFKVLSLSLGANYKISNGTVEFF